MCRALSIVIVALMASASGCGGGHCPPVGEPTATGPTSTDPVVARMMDHERVTCRCQDLACATTAQVEMARWGEDHRDEVERAVAELTRELQVDVHRGRADACRATLYDRATEADQQAADEAGGGGDAVIRMLARFSDQVCACPDMACAEQVMKAMSRLKPPHGKPTKAQMEKAMTIAQRMADCQKKLMADDSRPPPPEELARSLVKKLAFDAYPRWSMSPSHQGTCPTVDDLVEFVDEQPGLKDPWGRPYVIRCVADLPAEARGIAVESRGPDGREGTADDLRSWEE